MMKLHPLIFSFIFLVSVGVEGRCRKNRVKYIQQEPTSVPPSYFDFQSSLEDGTIARDADSSYMSSSTSQRPNLSCLLFSDDGCKVSCNLMCDINGCRQSDGYCSQKFYCICNEIYVVKNQPVTADQFRKLAFDDLWNNKFKPTDNSANLKNRILQNDELYGFIMPLLQNPHKNGRDVKEALQRQYPKQSWVKNLKPREIGVKAKFFGNGADPDGENLHLYIQNMMNSIQRDPVRHRLNHTRYMRRLINLMKDINNAEDLSYILRQIKQTGSDRLFERLRRYLMKRGYYFDDYLRPISKKAACCCMKKKAKNGLKHRLKSTIKRFFFGDDPTSSNQEDNVDSGWIEAPGEDQQIEIALIEELIGSNDSEKEYPSNSILDEPPVSNPDPQENPVPSSQDTTISIPPQSEKVIEEIPQNTIENKNQMLPPNDTQYIIISDASVPEYLTTSSQQPVAPLPKSNYPKYGTFFSNSDKNQIPNKPISEFPTSKLVNYGNQQIPNSSMAPEIIIYEEFVQPNNELQNSQYPSKPFGNSKYFDTPDSTIFTMPQNQVKPPGSTVVNQYPEIVDHSVITPSQKLDEYPEKSSEFIILPSKSNLQNLDQSPQPVITHPEMLEGPSKLPANIEQNLQPIIDHTQDMGNFSTPPDNSQTSQQILHPSTTPIQNLENPIPSQSLDNPTPIITQNPTSPLESLPSPQTIKKSSQKIVSPPQNLLQKFVTGKPSPKISDSSPYLKKSLASSDTNTFDIPDAVPSLESLFVKHNPSPGKTSTTSMPSPEKSPTIANNPETYIIQMEPMKITEPETQSYQIQSPPVMQKPKDKVYYQVLMDENGNIIKSANYKYPGQPQPSQSMEQFETISPPEYSSTIYQENQPLFDKFNKQKVLDAARLNPGQSKVLDYDLNSNSNVPVFDIPSDIDMLSNRFDIPPEDIVDKHGETDESTRKTLPISYDTNDGAYEYHIPSNMEIINHQGDTQAGPQYYYYEIDGGNRYDIPINPETNDSIKEWQILTPAGSQYPHEIENSEITTPSNHRLTSSQYPFEIDRDNSQIQTNDGLTLDYEDNNQGGPHNWSGYSIKDSDVTKFPNNGIDDISIFDASDKPNGHTMVQKVGPNNNNNNIKQNQIFYDMISSSENNPEPSSNSIVKTNSKSSTNSIPLPIKLIHINNTTWKKDSTEDYSANRDLIDPEDDVMNF